MIGRSPSQNHHYELHLVTAERKLEFKYSSSEYEAVKAWFDMYAEPGEYLVFTCFGDAKIPTVTLKEKG